MAEISNLNYTTSEHMEILSCLQLGIEHALLNTKGKKDILMRDFNSIESTSFPKEGSGKTPSHNSNSFTFKSYASETFHHLRKQFGINQNEFIDSICQMPLKALHNPGASGSLLFITEDDNYILKTVSDKEARFLQQLLPGYWMNLHQNSKTLIPKFFGLFGYQTVIRSMRFVIMNNVLPTNIKYQLKYDLKGSSYHRKAPETEVAQGAMPPTQKDIDFQDKFPKGIIMTEDKRDLLMDVLKRDCDVLESFDIMDYSLLVGVHNVTQVLKEAENVAQVSCTIKKPRSILRSRMSINMNSCYDCPTIKNSIELATHLATVPPGGFPAKLPDGDFVILFIGVIDILQNFRAKKRIEHAVKSIVINKETISVQKPSFYAKRFLRFMKEEVIVEEVKKSKKGVTFGVVRRRSLVEVNSFDEETTIPEDYPDRPGSAEGERKMGMLKRQSVIQNETILNESEQEVKAVAMDRARKTLKISRQTALDVSI
ncbi:Phosphatidylinositol-4-phosphate 5-kinase type I [Oopsacas minuta]|uniref:Phosphatidylinositol-4-phosphate 5-kinase type I n=1 Tax=Oopsacas minuta TaxID=111878 RepID=A0AAV7K5T0_9METZ|nr:Phosphatidylinositol-4-phosphate 5-kinase type I [Oopsacas minuta]